MGRKDREVKDYSLRDTGKHKRKAKVCREDKLLYHEKSHAEGKWEHSKLNIAHISHKPNIFATFVIKRMRPIYLIQ